MTQPVLGVGRRLVDAVLIAAVEGDAGTAGEHESPSAVSLASGNDMLRAKRIDFVVIAPRPPHAGYSRHVKHRVPACTRRDHLVTVANVAANDFDPQPLQIRRHTATENANFIAARDELL